MISPAKPTKDPVYLTPSVSTFGHIAPATTLMHKITIDLTVSDAIFFLQWLSEDSCLNLVLYSPNGTRIDVNSSLTCNETCCDETTYKYYAIHNPECGNWTVEVTAIKVPIDGEVYSVLVTTIANLTLSLSTDKEYYNPKEPIPIIGRLVYEGTPLIGASVIAEIIRPDNTVDKMPLFDDGSHGDARASDGNYSNIYENATLEGIYSITAQASGTTPTGDYFITGDSLLVQTLTSEFTGYYTDYGSDTDGDGLYDYLTIEVGVNPVVEGVYHINGVLYDTNETEIVWTSNDSRLNVGCQIVKLNFEGINIRKHGVDGPYYLKRLTLFDENWKLLKYIPDAYNTSAYNYTDFQAPLAEFTSDYADYGIDFDGDGFYDYLTIDVGVNVITAGNYSLMGYLFDANGSEIVWSIDYGSLGVGNHTLHLDFNGKTIQMHGVNGPYYLKHLMLSGKNWTFADYISDAHTTSVYNYTDFVDPVSTENEVTISGVGLGELSLIVSFTDTIPVFAGRYNYDLVGINIPQRPNNFTIITSEVKNLKVGVKKIQDNTTRIWVTQTIAAPEGIATIQSDLPSPGNYHVKIFGNAAEGASEVDLELTAVKKITVDGNFSLSIDISGFPAGKYTVTATADTGCFTDLTLEGLPLAP